MNFYKRTRRNKNLSIIRAATETPTTAASANKKRMKRPSFRKRQSRECTEEASKTPQRDLPRKKTSSGVTAQTEDESSINPKPIRGTTRRTQRSRNVPERVKKVLPEVEAACQEFVDYHTKLDVLRQEFKQLSEMVVDDKAHLKCCANKERNRYENIPCLDATRLVLQNEDGGNDFIYANKCTFEKSDRDFYIITQAPMKNTVEDFRHAVFSENSPSIVVLCVFYEQGRESSESFWPLNNGEYKYYGKMFINNKKIYIKSPPRFFEDCKEMGCSRL